MDSNSPRNKRKQELNLKNWSYSKDSKTVANFLRKTEMQRNFEAGHAPKRWHSTISRRNKFQEIHNEQERIRRRELSLLYEFIRQCTAEDDISTYLPDGKKTVEKLTYSEILEISIRMTLDECHDIEVSKHLMEDIERLEALCRQLELPLDFLRPERNYMQCHRDISAMMANILTENKRLIKCFAHSPVIYRQCEFDAEDRMPPAELARRYHHQLTDYLKRATRFQVTEHPTNMFATHNWRRLISHTGTSKCRQEMVNK